jgi:5-methylthioadenosine/S-adenosylhomocysteine deaminase
MGDGDQGGSMPNTSPVPDGARRCDLLLTEASVITVDDARRVLEPGAVAITGDRIVAVGPMGELADLRASRTIECRGRAVLPGFVDGHNHAFQTLARGLGEGRPVYEWLTGFMWPYARAITLAEATIAVKLTAIEAARAGVTAILDDHYAPPTAQAAIAVAGAIEEVGLRGVVGRGIFGPVTEAVGHYGLPEYLFGLSAEEELEATSEAMEASASRRVRVWPAPDGGFVDRELIRQSVALAREAGVGWHTHCSALAPDPAAYVATYGERPVEWLHREGLLGPLTTLAHGVWLSEAEIDAIGATRAGVAHCPVSNMYFADGVIRLRDLRQAGAIVALGTDGNATSQRIDLFEQMKAAALLQRIHRMEAASLFAPEALELATREGARYLGVDAGTLEPGRLADLVVIDLERPHLQPLHDVVAAVVHAARPSDVVMTIVGGRVVYEDGRCTNVDEVEVVAEARARARELRQRIAVTGGTGPVEPLPGRRRASP